MMPFNMKPLKVGVIGYGWVSGAHIEAINATGKAEVVAVYSSRGLDATELSKRHGGSIQTYSRIEDLLADSSIQVVSICSYPKLHTEHAIAAAKAGKHLIIEKPLALNWNDCLRIQQAVQASGVQVCVCFECRFSSQFKVTKSVIDQGLLGDVHYGEVDYYHGIGPWYGQYRWNTQEENGGSSLLSAGCHALDALLLCMGGKVESVTSLATRSENADFKSYEYPTTSVTLLQFENGKIGKVASVIDCLQPYYFHVHLVGSEGSLLDNKFHSQKTVGLDKSKWSQLAFSLLDSGDVSDHPYQSQFDCFFSCLEKGVKMPLTDLDTALETQRVIFAADLSAKEKRPVKITEI